MILIWKNEFEIIENLVLSSSVRVRPLVICHLLLISIVISRNIEIVLENELFVIHFIFISTSKNIKCGIMLKLLIVVIKTFYIIFVTSFPTIGENFSS